MLNENDSAFLLNVALEELRQTQQELRRPCRLLEPELVKDGDAWLAYYPDHKTGCNPDHLIGCGDTPDAAERDFDAHYYGTAGH